MSQRNTTAQQPPERELPMLAGIASFFYWWEEFLNIINGPVLLFGGAIALIDLLTDGQLTTDAPVFLFAWAISQALGVDAQFYGAFSRVRRSSAWSRVGWILLGIVLGYAVWQAGYVFIVQQSEHITEAAALSQLGIPVQAWLGWRAFLAVLLIALSALTRYRAPRLDVASDTASERERLQAALELEPLRQRLRAQQVGGWRAVAQTALGQQSPAQTPVRDTSSVPPAPDDEPPPDGPNGGGGGMRTFVPAGTGDYRYGPPTALANGYRQGDNTQAWNTAENSADATGTDDVSPQPLPQPPDATPAPATRHLPKPTRRAAAQRRKVKRLSADAYNRRHNERVIEVRGWLANGERVTQTRIKREHHVNNNTARRILAEAQQPLRAVASGQ